MTTEPETLGPADVADVPIGNSSLDKAFRYLASKGEPATVAEIAARAYQHECEPGDVHYDALHQNLANDARFVVSTGARGAWVAIAHEPTITETATEPADAVNGAISQDNDLRPSAETPVKDSSAPVTEAPASDGAEQTAEDSPEPATVGDKVIESVARGGVPHVPFPVEPGTRVIYRAPNGDRIEAVVRNVKTVEGWSTYDLATANARFDGVAAADIEEDIAARDLLAQREARMRALEEHWHKGEELAQRIAQMEADEVVLAKDLSEHRKKLEALRDELVEHNGASPFASTPGARQQTIADAGAPIPKDPPKAPPAEKKPDGWGLDALAARIASNAEWLMLEALGVGHEALAAAALSQTASTGKPPKVRPIEVRDPRGGEGAEELPYVLVAVQHAGKVPVAVLVKVYPLGAWPFEAKPLELPSDDRTEALRKLGRWAGFPVKVGRKRCVLGRDEEALLVAVPSDADQPLQKALGAPPPDAEDGDEEAAPAAAAASA